MATTSTFGMRIARGLIRQSAISTLHQAIAFDAVDQISGADAVAWRRMFLRHAQVFALGADAPDVDFRDFKNHLLFPADNFWGGAQGKAQCWYRNLVTALQKREWQNATYCAGVLSHYLADAAHPLHTAQSQADNDIYAALNFCAWQSYRGLCERAGTLAALATVPQTSGERNLDRLLRASATAAHAQYGPLLAHFDLRRALENPADGLDVEGYDIMAVALASAVMLVATVLDAALTEAAVEAPKGGLSTRALQGAVAVPLTAFSNWHHRAAVGRALAAMKTEFLASGHLEATLPDEVRVKRDAYAKEVLGEGAAVPAAASALGDNVVVFAPARTASPPRENDGEKEADVIDLKRQRRVVERPRPAPRKSATEPIRIRSDVNRQIGDELAAASQSLLGTGTKMPAA